MELTYLEVNGIRLPIRRHMDSQVAPTCQSTQAEKNEDTVARVSEMIENLEVSESFCVVLSTSGGF
jgi:hypothetical protein